jgi:hypothetical protein
MPTQQLLFLVNILKMANPDWALFTVGYLVLAPVSRGETTWDLANRICDRYFSETAQQKRPVTSQAA